MANVTSGVKNAATGLFDSFKNLGTTAANAARTTGDSFKTGSGFTAKLLLKPVEWGLKVASWPVKIATTSFRVAPVISTVGVAVTALLGVRSLIRGKAEQRTQEEFQAQMAAPMPQGPYTNSVTSQDMANLNAALAAKAPAGHAANVEAEQAVPAVAAR